MSRVTIESIYTKNDESVPEYLEVIFETNLGFYKVGYGQFDKVNNVSLSGFTKCDFVDDLKSKYGVLDINELRVTYDNEMYFLVSNKFLLTLGYTLNSETEFSINEFWFTEDIHDSNNNALKDFFELEKVSLLT